MGGITGGSGVSPGVDPDPPVIAIIGKGGRDKPRVGIPTTRNEGLQGMGKCTVQLYATWWLVTELSPIPRAVTYRGTESRVGRVGYFLFFLSICLNCSNGEERVS